MRSKYRLVWISPYYVFKPFKKWAWASSVWPYCSSKCAEVFTTVCIRGITLGVPNADSNSNLPQTAASSRYFHMHACSFQCCDPKPNLALCILAWISSIQDERSPLSTATAALTALTKQYWVTFLCVHAVRHPLFCVPARHAVPSVPSPSLVHSLQSVSQLNVVYSHQRRVEEVLRQERALSSALS